MPDEFVALCQCWDLAEAQAIRASLAARGIAVFIDGEHHRGIMGVLGAGVALRVMVRGSSLELARELAADVIPDIAPDPVEHEALRGEGWSPQRRAQPEDLVDFPDDEDEPELEPNEDDELESSSARKKSIAVAVLLGVLGLAIGTLHMYAGHERTAGALFVVAALGGGLMFAGRPEGALLLIAVWLIDITRGLVLLVQHNREVTGNHARALEAAPPR